MGWPVFTVVGRAFGTTTPRAALPPETGVAGTEGWDERGVYELGGYDRNAELGGDRGPAPDDVVGAPGDRRRA